MKSSTGWMVFAALAAGFAGGWLLKETPPMVATNSPTPHSPLSRNSMSTRGESPPLQDLPLPTLLGGADSTGSPEVMVSGKTRSEFEELRNLSDEEFGKQMLALWFAPQTPENLLKKALFASVCDGPRAVAFYEQYKKSKGILMNEEGGQELRGFMSMIARSHGQEFMEHLLVACPEGPADLDSLMAGWVNSDANGAIAWLNQLPDGSPVFSQSAKGMIWALSAMSPKAAMDVFVTLDPSERDPKMYHLMSSSAVKNHGIEGLNELVALCPNEQEKSRVMMAGMQYAKSQPPAKFVDGMAGNLEQFPGIQSQFSTMARKWASTMPEEALSWIGENAKTPANSKALTILASRLIDSGHQQQLVDWIEKNPQAPGRVSVEAALNPPATP